MAVELSCVVPAYNEEQCVERVLKDLMRALDSAGIGYEIIAVDNGSADSTGEILDRMQKEFPRLRAMRFERNQRFGGAILKGFAASRGEVMGFTCADGEVPPESVADLYRALRGSGASVAKARRTGRKDGPVRMVMALVYRLLARALFRVKVLDINGYPVLLTREAYGEIRPAEEGWMINLEILSGARRLGLAALELDVPHRDRAGGKSHVDWRTPLAFLAQLVRFRLRPQKNPGRP